MKMPPCEGFLVSPAKDGQPARIIRMMSASWALAHKLAAWNERRLLRDLYDCYFFVARLGELPDIGELRNRLAKILNNQSRPVQIIFAGKAHPADQPGQELIQHIFQLSRSDSLAGKVFFLENYDMRLGRRLVQGVDIWLNTPRRPLEASGTSGQKAAANGALNLSIPDGWWPEGYNGTNGWVIGHEEAYDDQDHQDREDAQSLYKTLESIALPLYYQRQDDLPRQWIQRMKDSIATLTWKFSASRMVRDYTLEAYLPAARRGSERESASD